MRIDMTDGIVVSQKGVSFTEESVAVMRSFFEIIKRNNCGVLCYSVSFDKKGQIQVALGGDYELQPSAISDQVENIPFYWYADPPGFDAVRSYCIDKEWERPTRLISLSDQKPK
jgi:hypothetical protein